MGHVCNYPPVGLIFDKGKVDKGIIPPGIVVVHDFVDEITCKEITDYANNQPGKKLSVGGRDAESDSVTSGMKYAIVSWLVARGSHRISNNTPGNAILVTE